MAKNRNTFEKRRREMEKKRKAEEKRERRRLRKELGREPEGTAAHQEHENPDIGPTLARVPQLPAE